MTSTIFNTSRALQFPQELFEFSRDFVPINSPSMSPSSSSYDNIVSISPSSYPSPSPASAAPLVPAFFVLGDSSVDCGTNNYLGTFARADRLPYALYLGLPFVPSYLGQTGSVEDMIQGVNYASAAAGIIFSSGSELGQRISFTQQIQQLTDTYQQFILEMGEESAANLISESVFYISIGVNDYIHYYLSNESNVQNMYLPWNFNQFLASTVSQEVKNLYDISVRKVVLMGLPPIGCAPHYLWKYNRGDGECVEEINDMIMEFNYVMRYTVYELREDFPDLNIIFCDMYEGSMDLIKNYELYGFNVTTDACCGLGKFKGWIMCMSPDMACDDASNHIWWDQFHPTDAVNSILADNVWNSLHTKMCYPMNLKDMVAPPKS
ncbi:hypothetical protein QYF36_020846 [Acer negundo]|nr:hypothetical protein QYF36_020846 [Acer negundo]